MDVRVISIGALAAHPLWGEKTPVRTGHATTTLITAGEKRILVDPSLPGPALAARLGERANLKPSDITHVLLTSFRPDVRRGVMLFEEAVWWISEREREAVGVPLLGKLKEAAELGDESMREALELEAAILKRCEAAPDNLARERGWKADVFPLPGVTPGLSGVLVTPPESGVGMSGGGAGGNGAAVLICGDAVATSEHVSKGQILAGAVDLELAQESFREALEIADVLIPGRDNLMINPMKGLF